MIQDQISTGSRRKRQWRESGCSDPWYRNRTAVQHKSSPREPIPYTIPRSTSDGVSKCSLVLASGASGLRMGAAAPRLRPNIGCSRITSKSSATAAPPSTQPMVNASVVPTTPASPCKLGPTDKVLDEGGRGFNSLKRGRPPTPPLLLHEFFPGPRTFH